MSAPALTFSAVRRAYGADREMDILLAGRVIGTMEARPDDTAGEWWCAGLCPVECADAGAPGLAYVVLEIDGMSTLAADARTIARERIADGIERLANATPADDLAWTARRKVEAEAKVAADAAELVAAECDEGGALAMAQFLAERAEGDAEHARRHGMPNACRLLVEAAHARAVAVAVEYHR